MPPGTTNYLYYTSSWQLIEVRTGGTAAANVTVQTVWSAAYINAVVLQDTYSGGVIQPNSRIYFQQEANWDTTAIVGYNGTTGTWGVTQRYVYSPYGTITVLNADWSTPPTGAQPTVDNLYQGMTLDPVTGLYYARNRNYDPSLGRWINQDPVGYVNGANTYQFVVSNPVAKTDPQGRFWSWMSNVGNTLAGAAEYVGSGIGAVAENPSSLGAGTLQGLANVANGVQNTVIGMANIPADVANGVGYLTAGDSTIIPVIPSPDWSNNLVVQNDPAHGISTFLGGQAATTLATLGLSQLGTAGEAANLVHLTDPVTEEAIGQSGALTGKAGIYALSNPTDNSWIDSILTGVPNAEGSVPISDAAASTFTPIPAAGPVSGWTSLAGGYFSPYASLDLATGTGQMSSLWSQASPYLKDMGASSTINLILQELTNINTQIQNLTSKCKQ